MQTSNKKKLVLVSIVAGICFFIGATFLGNSVEAAGSSVIPSFKAASNKVKKNAIFETNVLLSTGTNKISGASMYVTYPANILEYQDAQTNADCTNNNFKLNQLLENKADAKTGVLKLSRVEIAPDSQLPSGDFCMTTLRFKAKSSFWFWLPWYSRSGTLSFSDTSKWQIVGPSGVSSVSTEASGATLQVTETN